jgi:hypothetical protein
LAAHLKALPPQKAPRLLRQIVLVRREHLPRARLESQKERLPRIQPAHSKLLRPRDLGLSRRALWIRSHLRALPRMRMGRIPMLQSNRACYPIRLPTGMAPMAVRKRIPRSGLGLRRRSQSGIPREPSASPHRQTPARCQRVQRLLPEQGAPPMFRLSRGYLPRTAQHRPSAFLAAQNARSRTFRVLRSPSSVPAVALERPNL